MATPRTAVVMTIGAAALFGTSGTAQALGPEGITPIAVAEMRLGLGGLLMMAMLPLLGHRISELGHFFRLPLVWFSALGSMLFQVLYFTGVQYAGVALGSLLIMGSVPVFAGILGAFFGHRISGTWVAATAVCIAGLVLLSLDGIHGGDAIGVAAAITGGLCGATFVLATKTLIERGEAPVPANIASYLIAGVVLLPVLFLLPQSLNWVLTLSGAALALYLGFFAMALPNVLWVKGLTALSPGPSSTLMLTEPAVATLLGVFVLGETLAVIGVIGLVLVMGGLLFQGLSLAKMPDPVEPTPV